MKFQRFLIVCLTLVLIWSFLPESTMAATGDRAATEEYDLYVGRVRVTSDNCTNILGDQGTPTVQYDPATGILTLNGATITGEHYAGNNDTANIVAIGIDLTIRLNGSNTVGDGRMDYPIMIRNASLTIDGSGTLSVYGLNRGINIPDKNFTLNSGTVNTSARLSGVTARNITINGGILNATTTHWSGFPLDASYGTIAINSGRVTVKAQNADPKYGGLKAKSIPLGSEMRITAPVGAVVGQYGRSYYLMKNGAIVKDAVIEPLPKYPLWVGGEQVTWDNRNGITGDGITGTVKYDPATKTLTLDGAGITGEYAYEGPYTANIFTQNEELTIVLTGTNSIGDGSASHGINASRDLIIEGSGTVTVQGREGIYAAGNLSVNGGSVDATGSFYYGLYSFNRMVVDGGSVTAKGEDGGVFSNDTIVVNSGKLSGTMTGTSSDRGGIGADYGIVINSPLRVTTPVYGTPGLYGGRYSILDGNVPAKNAVIEPVYMVTVNGGNGNGEYAVGSSVTIIADAPPTDDMVFDEWIGAEDLSFTDGSATAAMATFTMPAHPVTLTSAYAATYTVTYKVVNGTWSDGTVKDKTEVVIRGDYPARIPTGMKAAGGYEGGARGTEPASDEM
ncbi:MAG: carbohydrate-binding domain-containing protein, partial [Clostridia bacterium]|nr:carbohydrate-binding domain-containing protein [Clostridia bacterium]